MDDKKNNKKNLDDFLHFNPPKKLIKPEVINPDEIDWLFLKKPKGEKNLFETGDTLFKMIVSAEKIQVGIWRALPGEYFWMDIHPDSDEIWYILKGECTLWLPETKEIKVAKAGEFFYVPAGIKNQSINRSTEELILIYVLAPGQ
ncbi:MAG: cupin domain-containing protein [Actinobacteria bacterium]|nr:cupin domain-containing protein [Actinomycetota bacterium]